MATRGTKAMNGNNKKATISQPMKNKKETGKKIVAKKEIIKEIKAESIVKKKVVDGKELVVAVLDKMNTLFTSGMGLVAALAWNEAVKNMFDQVFGQNNKNSIWAMFGYALVVTLIVVLVTFQLTKLVEKIKKKGDAEENGKGEK